MYQFKSENSLQLRSYFAGMSNDVVILLNFTNLNLQKPKQIENTFNEFFYKNKIMNHKLFQNILLNFHILHNKSTEKQHHIDK